MKLRLFPIAIAAVLSMQVFAANEAAGDVRLPKALSRGTAKYALCVGINHYSDDYGASSLSGCANDATVFRANLVELGGWASADTTLLTDDTATKEAIRAAIAGIAAKAVDGDTFVYLHSSHGGQDKGKDVFLCAHDDDYWDYELAEDLESFASGVKVVVVVDACHSGGLFKGAKGKDAKSGISAKQPFDLAQRVSAIMDAHRAKRLARGEKAAARQLTASEIGWVTAAEYNETSIDWGFYDTDKWLTDPGTGGSVRGGTFLGSFTWSWWNGSADAAGDNDGHFDAYEGWGVAKTFCENLNDFWNDDDSSFSPQFLNESVLQSVELGACSPLDITPLFPPPANDDFADATAITGESGTANGTTANATREEDEPWHNNGEESGSVWWRWTAPKDGEAHFDTQGSGFDTVMAVYTGDSLDSLTPIDANDDAGEYVRWSRCTFAATEGTTYHVAVAGYSATGDIVLNWAVLGEGEDFLLRVDDDGCLCGFLGNLPAELEIPAEVNGVAITSIGDSAFENCTSLTSVTIPAGVTAIGDYAFSGCEALETVTFGGNQDDIDIGYHAFWQTPWGVLPLAAPDADRAVALPDAMTGVSYWDDDANDYVRLGFTGGMPLEDEDGDDFFDVEIIDGALPDSMEIGRWYDDSSLIRIFGTPGDDEAGDYAFTVRVTDANGDSVEQAFTLTVAENPNHAPVIDSCSPENNNVHLEPGESQAFSVEAHDPDEGDTITTTWYVADDWDYVPGFDGVDGASITFSALDEGWYYVDVYVSDGVRETSQSWTVRVKETRPLAAPDADNAVALPDGMTGVHYWDDDALDYVRLGFTGGTPLEGEYGYSFFDVEVIDGVLPDSMWIEVWCDDSSGIYISGTPGDDEAGDYAFTVRVTDANGDSVEQAFTLTIASNPNHAPVIDSYSPETYNVHLEPGEEQAFSVEAHDPDEGDTIATTWYVEDDWGDYVPGFDGVVGDSIIFSSLDEGWYGVYAYASDGDRGTRQSWSVRVKETEPLAAPDAGNAVALPDALTGVFYWDDDADDYVRLGFTGGTPMEDEYGDWYFAAEIIDGTLPGSMWISGVYNSDSSYICVSGEPDDDEAGDYAFTVRVTDANGDSVEQAFTLTVAANPNHAPVIDSYSPDNYSVRLEPGEAQVFSVEAHDPDEGDTIATTWYVYDEERNYVPGFDGLVGEGITFSALDEGWYEAFAHVSDGERETIQNWSVHVKETKPLAAPDADNAVALPDALTGDYYYEAFGFTGGTPLYDGDWDEYAFDVEIIDGALPDSMWVDRWCSDASSISLGGTPGIDEVGDYAFTVRVTDANGDSVEQAFTLAVVENPNPPPVIDSREPAASSFRAVAGLAQTFSVEAHDPKGDKLAYYWDVSDSDGERLYRSGDGGDGPEFSWTFGEPGSYSVEVEVSDGTYYDWTRWHVEVVRLAVTTEALPTGAVGTAYTATLEAAGGTVPYTWSVVPPEYGESVQASTFAATGTAQDWRGVDESWDLALPFAFPFFGSSYTTAKVNSNGTISFGGNDLSDCWRYDESAFLGTPVIAAMWNDLETYSGDVYVESGAEAVTVRWEGYYYDSGGLAVNVSATLCQDGRIILSYGEGNEEGGTIGLSAGDGVTAQFAEKSGKGSLASADDIVFTPGGAEFPAWFACSADGVISGTPTGIGEWSLGVVVTDSEGLSAWKALTLAVQQFQKVVFDGNGGEPGLQTNVYVVGRAYGALPDAAWAGYTFDGWWTAATGGEQVTEASQVTQENERTLWAHWTANQDTVVLDAQGGSGGTASVTASYGAAMPAIKVPTRAGYAFGGYFTEPGGAGTPYYTATGASARVWDIAGAATLYAKWTVQTYTVSFNAAGGTGTMAAQQMTRGASAALRKNAFSRKGYVFMGWRKTQGGAVAFGDGATVKDLAAAGGTVQLYAGWAKATYQVAFNANGGKGKMAKQKLTYGKAAKLRKNAFKRKGYTFLGWAKTKKGEVAYKNAAKVKNLRTDGKTTTLYAKWAKNTYQVAFNANGGKGKMAKQQMTYGKKAKLRKNTFKRNGYTFLGWSKTKKGAVVYKNGAKVLNLRTDGKTTTLYAQWKAAKKGLPKGVEVTTSDGADGSAVADGDESTGWTPEETKAGAWVVLSFAKARDVAEVEVVGENLPEGMRVLLSEDAESWREGVPGPARYVWVAFPESAEGVDLREVRVVEAE